VTSRTIILASGSAIRADILRNAGLSFEIMRPDVDEDIIKQRCFEEGLDLEATALALAEAKSLAVAVGETTVGEDDLVIGSDQILEFEGRPFDKPKSMAEARARLLDMAGKPHTLINAVAVSRGRNLRWRHIDRPRLMMRSFTAGQIDAYLDAAGLDILNSVGAYQVEKLGARLFERIDGDHYAVLGLSLYPLLEFLRQEGALAF